jgi:hypothetical protein
MNADTRLGVNTAVATGDNICNLTGADQTLSTAIRHGGGSKTVFIGVQNDYTSAGSFKVYGTPGNAKFAVKYLYGATNVTTTVTRGTFRTPSLAPGATCLLRAQITATTPLRGQVRNLYIISTSAADPTAKDCALIQAKSN